MKTINLYFKFQFTSISPDAQPISLGIVSDEEYRIKEIQDRVFWRQANGEEPKKDSKSFYTEFSFDINRCDDWVKENVILKTDVGSNKNVYPEYKPVVHFYNSEEKGIAKGYGDTERIKGFLKEWLKQFSDYQIQFVCDCGSLDWLWMSNYLLDERVENKAVLIIDRSTIKEEDIDKFIQEYKKQPHVILRESDCKASTPVYYKTGFPKLPDNISPVPSDLNDLIATKKGITPKEAFDLDREELTVSRCLIIDEKAHKREVIDKMIEQYQSDGTFDANTAQELKSETYPKLKGKYKHNALFAAKVIKEIYQKLK